MSALPWDVARGTVSHPQNERIEGREMGHVLANVLLQLLRGGEEAREEPTHTVMLVLTVLPNRVRTEVLRERPPAVPPELSVPRKHEAPGPSGAEGRTSARVSSNALHDHDKRGEEPHHARGDQFQLRSVCVVDRSFLEQGNSGSSVADDDDRLP